MPYIGPAPEPNPDGIKDLKDSVIYPDPGDYPDNDAVMEDLYEDLRNEFPDAPDTVIEYTVQKRFEELPEPGDYDDL